MTKFDTAVPDVPVTSPDLDTEGSQAVSTFKDFSGALTLDLTDDEIARAAAIVISVSRKYSTRTATRENLAAAGDEMVYRLADEADILAKFDPVPLAQGEPPRIEFIGKVSGDSTHKYGLDHEKKAWEVQHANDKGESFYGEEKVRGRLGR